MSDHDDERAPDQDDERTPDQDAELEQLALEETKLAAEVAAIEERRATIKAILRDRLPRGTHHLGAHTVTVRAGARRLNAARLAQAFPFTDRPDLYRATIDPGLARERVAPVELAPFYDEGTPTVVVS